MCLFVATLSLLLFRDPFSDLRQTRQNRIANNLHTLCRYLISRIVSLVPVWIRRELNQIN